MKFSTLLRNSLSKATKVFMASALFGGIALGGTLSTASASAPQFNCLSGDLPTLQVAKPNAAWGTSVSGVHRGDVVNLLLWDHNCVLNSTALNVRLRIALGAAATTPTATGFVSADNAATVSGMVNINTGGETDGLAYIPGSAIFYNNVANNHGGFDLTPAQFPTGVNADDVVSNGINIGTQLGCYQYAHAVQIQVRLEGGAPVVMTNKAVALDGGSQNYGLSTAANPADKVDFRVYLQNSGTATGTNPEIVDQLDSHLSYVPNSSYIVIKKNNQDFKVPISDDMINIQGNKLTWAFDDMAPVPDAALYLYFQTQVAGTDQFPVGTTNFQNCAVGEFSNAPAVTTNCVAITVTKQNQPVITFNFHKEVSNDTLNDQVWHHDNIGTAAPGDKLSYRLTITNTGNTPAQNVLIKDLLPAGVTFDGNVKLIDAAHPNGQTIESNSIVNNGFTIPTVTNGSAGTEQIVFDALVNPACAGTQTLSNIGQAFYLGQKVGQDNADVILSCDRSLVIEKQILTSNSTFVHDAGNVGQGSTISYRITVINNGTTTVQTPIARDVLPSNVTYVANSLAVDGEIQAQAGQAAFFNQGIVLTDLPSGMGKTITYKVIVNNCPTDLNIVNTAFAKGDNTAEVKDSAQAELVCSTPTPTPPVQPTPPVTPPTTPQLPHTGGEDLIFGLAGLAGTGFGGRFYLLKNKLKKQARNIHIL